MPPSWARCRSRRSRPTRRPRSARPRSRRCSRGETPAEPRLINTCYSLVAPDYGITVAGVYKPTDGVLADIAGRGRRQPDRCAAREPRAGSAIRRRLVQDDHRRGVRLKRLGDSGRACCSARRPRRRRSLRPYTVAGDAIPASLTGAPGDAGTRPEDRHQPAGWALPVVPFGPISAGAVPGHHGAGPEGGRFALD